MVVFEGVEQPGIAQRGCRPRLVARPPIAVERNSDQLDLGDFRAPRVRTTTPNISVAPPKNVQLTGSGRDYRRR
jgi:hypothetical protein